MRHLVDENPRKLRKRAIQSDPPFAKKRSRVHRPVPVPQSACDIHLHRRAGQRWHSPPDRKHPVVLGVFKLEGTDCGHPFRVSSEVQAQRELDLPVGPDADLVRHCRCQNTEVSASCGRGKWDARLKARSSRPRGQTRR